MKILSYLSLAILLGPLVSAQTLYFAEDFESTNAPVFTCWFSGDGAQIKSVVTDARAFGGKRSAFFEADTLAYFQIPLPKSLKWDRKAPDGIGNQPLYLSARVFAERVVPQTPTRLGFNASIVPRHRPSVGGNLINGGNTANVGERTNQWQLIVLDVGSALREEELLGALNPDHVVLQTISLMCYGGGAFYLDDIRLATTPPTGWTPPPPATPVVNAAAYFRRDPKLESMILHGCYGGIGSVIGDVQLHPWVMRDMKRHYLNFAGPSFDFRVNAPERRLKEFDLVLQQAEAYDMPVIPMSYIGSRYNPVAGMTDEQLRAAMVKIVRRYKDKSHLLAWYLEEEPGADRLATYLKEKRWVDEEDPNHNCLMIFNGGEGPKAIGPAQSIILVDIYPIGGPNSNPWFVPKQVHDYARRFQQPFVLTDQIFAADCYGVPTVGQFRLMNYGALAEGAKGFCHFAYAAPPVYEQKVERPPMYGTMVDLYGTPSPIHDEIERHLGPDLFSIGELLRTCHPEDVPAGITVKSGTVEDALEHELPAIAVRRLVDGKEGYEILALYNNNPNASESGVLQIARDWLGDRVVMDLTAHSEQITCPKPILLEGDHVKLRLAAGDGRFLAVLTRDQAPGALRRMQTTRFEAVRKMVEFDLRWLQKVGLQKPQAVDLRPLVENAPVATALEQLLRLDRANQDIIRGSALGEVLRQLARARNELSAADQAIAGWARFKTGQPFPPEVEPGKSWCDAQRELSGLYVGFSDLAFERPPGELLRPVAVLAKLCASHAEQSQQASARGVPTQTCTIHRDTIKDLESELKQLGWVRPRTSAELGN